MKLQKLINPTDYKQELLILFHSDDTMSKIWMNSRSIREFNPNLVQSEVLTKEQYEKLLKEGWYVCNFFRF
jgi:hypothetical protein